jgi:hypothetical protein
VEPIHELELIILSLLLFDHYSSLWLACLQTTPSRPNTLSCLAATRHYPLKPLGIPISPPSSLYQLEILSDDGSNPLIQLDYHPVFKPTNIRSHLKRFSSLISEKRKSGSDQQQRSSSGVVENDQKNVKKEYKQEERFEEMSSGQHVNGVKVSRECQLRSEVTSIDS